MIILLLVEIDYYKIIKFFYYKVDSNEKSTWFLGKNHFDKIFTKLLRLDKDKIVISTNK